MGTEIKRLYAPILESYFAQVENIEVDCIKTDGAVYRGVIVKMDKDSLILKNGMRNKVKIDLSELSEIAWHAG